MNKFKNKEDQLPPRWLIEDQLAQQKEDAKYLIKYNKRQIEKEKLILADLEKCFFAPKFEGTITGVLNGIDETKYKIRMYRKEVLLYIKEVSNV